MRIAEKVQSTISHRQSDSKRAFAKLYDLIIRNIDLKDKKSLVISPDGLLGLVPFEAFYDTQSKKYLVQQFKVRYIPSGKELVKLYQNQNRANEDIVVFANPDFGLEKSSISEEDNTQRGVVEALKGSSFKSLSGSIVEADNISSLFRDTIQTYMKERANEANLLKVNSPRILHLSTHGFFVDDKSISNPLFKSGILLSGANYAIKTKTGNGIVTGLELAGLNLKGTELVVLSACLTGVGEIEEAEGVAGINKAFMLAGAKQIVMSLWSVSDKATTELMRLFYENIAKKKMSYSDALREAKIFMIEKKSYGHPFYWSAFVGSGRD
jgi:CHAT domain-containing protein